MTASGHGRSHASLDTSGHGRRHARRTCRPSSCAARTCYISSDIWALGVMLVRNGRGHAAVQRQHAVRTERRDPQRRTSSVPGSHPARIEDRDHRLPREGFAATLSRTRWMCAPRSKAYRPRPPRFDRWAHRSRRHPIRPPLVTVTVTRRRALWIGAGATRGRGFRSRLVATVLGRRVSSHAGGASPRQHAGDDPDLEYLCDGITESLIQQVSKLRSFRVRPIGIVLPFKGAAGDPQVAGRQLGVETVLAGTHRTPGPAAAHLSPARGRGQRPAALGEHVRSRGSYAAQSPGRDRRRDHGRWPAGAIDDQRA